MLSEFFLSEGTGLPPTKLYCDSHRELNMTLALSKMSTDQLSDEYYQERLSDQYSISLPEYGVLEVRVYFRLEGLHVEIFSARDVIPLDPQCQRE